MGQEKSKPMMGSRIGKVYHGQHASYEVDESMAPLGKGSQGVVLLGRCLMNNSPVALKRYTSIDENTRSKISAIYSREAQLLQDLEHEFIVRIIDAFEDEASDQAGARHVARHLFIVTEYCEGGDVHKLIEERAKTREKIRVEDALACFIDMLGVLKYLTHKEEGNDQPIAVHRDIKPGNMLLKYDEKEKRHKVKLADFGVARYVDTTNNSLFTQVGTWPYCPPEFNKVIRYNSSVDIWALGVSLFQVLTLMDVSDLMREIRIVATDQGPGKMKQQIYSYIDDWALRKVLIAMLHHDYHQRPGAKSLLDDPIVQGWQYLVRFNETDQAALLDAARTNIGSLLAVTTGLRMHDIKYIRFATKTLLIIVKEKCHAQAIVNVYIQEAVVSAMYRLAYFRESQHAKEVEFGSVTYIESTVGEVLVELVNLTILCFETMCEHKWQHRSLQNRLAEAGLNGHLLCTIHKQLSKSNNKTPKQQSIRLLSLMSKDHMSLSQAIGNDNELMKQLVLEAQGGSATMLNAFLIFAPYVKPETIIFISNKVIFPRQWMHEPSVQLLSNIRNKPLYAQAVVEEMLNIIPKVLSQSSQGQDNNKAILVKFVKLLRSYLEDVEHELRAATTLRICHNEIAAGSAIVCGAKSFVCTKCNVTVCLSCAYSCHQAHSQSLRPTNEANTMCNCDKMCISKDAAKEVPAYVKGISTVAQPKMTICMASFIKIRPPVISHEGSANFDMGWIYSEDLHTLPSGDAAQSGVSTVCYLEMNINCGGERDAIHIGVSSIASGGNYQLPGLFGHSVGYQCSTGSIFRNSTKEPYGHPTGTGDSLGCGITSDGGVYFVRNGHALPLLANVFKPGDTVRVIIVLGEPGASVEVRSESIFPNLVAQAATLVKEPPLCTEGCLAIAQHGGSTAMLNLLKDKMAGNAEATANCERIDNLLSRYTQQHQTS